MNAIATEPPPSVPYRFHRDIRPTAPRPFDCPGNAPHTDFNSSDRTGTVAGYRQPSLDVPDAGSSSPLDHLAALMGDRTMSAKRFGSLGEQYAANWLEVQGWVVLSRNWRTRYGELDIVALTPERIVAFVEVKSRRNAQYGVPQEAVTPAKQRNLRRAACEWLVDRRNRVPHAGVRFDVITVVMHLGRPSVLHIPNAF
ncbi:YraN family protein [Bifidobacterium callitrichidarum]|uniref:UPF0102 protein DF196_04500 n=1 Tax=Bifidobacterium callitrichidarum TaxID=2052941 RepID=A0A2U2NAS7_9BIFI|nr:YraN family protein [Bifidobacterium callitrichidarum]PWG66255.1 YraN family protein [Bifidobacterium callitrichidarum]